MKHLSKGLLLILSLISLTACTTPIKEGHIVDKHMTESHKETNAYMMGDETIFSENKNLPNIILMYTVKTKMVTDIQSQFEWMKKPITLRRLVTGGPSNKEREEITMHYGILDQYLNQLRMGFANADPSELASDAAFHILEVTDDQDILAYHKQYPDDYHTILTMHGFEIVTISEDIYQAMLDESIETAVVSTEAKYLWPETYR